MGDHEGHSHGVSADSDKRYLVIALALLVAFMIAEVIVAVISGSLALLSDAGHMLSDVGAILASLWALRLAARPATDQHTFGWKRAEILSAAGNGITLLVVAGIIAIEAVRRLFEHPAVDGGPVIVVALVGVAVNLVVAWTLAKANRGSLNVEGAYQHILTDLYAFVGTLIAGVVIVTTGYERADAIASLVVVGLMLKSARDLLRGSSHILLEAAPDGLVLSDIRQHLVEMDGVVDVHDLHAWTITSGMPAMSAHITVTDGCLEHRGVGAVLDELAECVRAHFGIDHATFQVEPESHREHEDLGEHDHG